MLIVPLLLVQNGADAGASPAPAGRHRGTASRPGIRRGRLVPHIKAASPPGRPSSRASASATDPVPDPVADRAGATGPIAAMPPSQEAVRREAPVIATLGTEPSATAPSARAPTTTAPTTTQPTASPATSVAPDAETEGQVTYYRHPAGTCASPWLPFGTVVHVTNPANGVSVSCVVDDREADTARAIDLATSTFAAIAPLSQGVIDAELSW